MSFGSFTFGGLVFSAARETSANLVSESSINVSLIFKIYAGTSEFVTLPTDALATQPFFGTLVQPLSFKRSILGSDIIGTFTSGVGELDLVNTDGGYDFLIQTFAIDGRPIVVKIGREGDAYDKFYTIFSGTASDWSVEEDAVRVTLVDNGYKLSVPSQSNLYGGTGGLDGTSDLVGKRKPVALGYVYNVSPPLAIPSSLVFQVNDGPVSAISAVYDRGIAITPGADYATSAALLAATISAGTFVTCIAEGLFRLNTSPTGTITSDVIGDNTGGILASNAASIIRRIILRTQCLIDPADLSLPEFTLLNVLQPADIGYWISPDDTSTVADVMSNIMGSVGGWAGFKRNGKLEVGIFTTPTGDIPAAFVDKTDIFVIKRENLPTSLSPPPYRFRVAYQHNWTVQTDTAGGVSAARKGYLAESDRYAEAFDTSIQKDHPFARDRAPIASYFNLQADAQTEAVRLLALYRNSNRALYRFTLGLLPFSLDLGQIINVTYPRWDLTVGRNLRIVEMTENAQDNTIEVVAYG